MGNRILRSMVAGVSCVTMVALAAPAVADPGSQSDPPSWGLDRIDQRAGTDQLYRYQTRAENVTVYVIDTGVDGAHPDLAGRVEAGKDFVDGDDVPADANGHGTGLAGIVGGDRYGVAKGVHIVPIRVLDTAGGGATANVVAGIEWVQSHATQPSVALVGLGGPPNKAIDDAVGRLSATMPVAVPAGGSASDTATSSPGRVPSALTVSASSPSGRADRSANFGPGIDVYAPGVDIPTPGLGRANQVLSGTSVAAAHVAGAAALYRGLHPEVSARQAATSAVAGATEGVLGALPGNTANRLLYTLSGTGHVPRSSSVP